YFWRTCLSVKMPSLKRHKSSTKPWSFLSSITSGIKLMGASLARRFSASFLFALKPGEHTGDSLSARKLFLLKLRAHTGANRRASSLLFLERNHQHLLSQRGLRSSITLLQIRE